MGPGPPKVVSLLPRLGSLELVTQTEATSTALQPYLRLVQPGATGRPLEEETIVFG